MCRNSISQNVEGVAQGRCNLYVLGIPTDVKGRRHQVCVGCTITHVEILAFLISENALVELQHEF